MFRTKGGWISANNKLVCSVCGASFKKLSMDKFMQCPKCFSRMGVLFGKDCIPYKKFRWRVSGSVTDHDYST